MNSSKEGTMTHDIDFEVSFCVPTYDSYEITRILVDQLVSNGNTEFQVVISDDYSRDGSYERLMANYVLDDRVKVVRNKYSKGAKTNWFNSLVNGDGKWLYLVMNRDKLFAPNIDNLVNLLKSVDDNVACLMDRKTQSGKEIEYYCDNELLNRIIALEHPTGSIFRRDRFLSIDGLRYFESRSPYPESYIKFCLVRPINKGAYIRAGVFTYQTNINKCIVKSKFDNNDENNAYYSPNVYLNQRIEFIKLVNQNIDSWNKVDIDSWIAHNYTKLLDEVTYSCRYHLEDYEWISHYGIRRRRVLRDELHLNVGIYTERFIDGLRELGIEISEKTRKLLEKKKELRRAELDDIDLLDSQAARLRIINSMLYKLLEAHQKGRCLGDYLFERGYESVAIYGFSVVGRAIYNELRNSNIYVKYAVDRNYLEIYSDLEIVGEIKANESVDLVIVTAVFDNDELINIIEKKGINAISAEKIIYEM